MTAPDPVNLPGLGLSEIRYLIWPATTVDDPYHYWYLDSGPLIMVIQAEKALAILTKLGFKPPWIRAGMEYETGRVVVCLPDHAVRNLKKKPVAVRSVSS